MQLTKVSELGRFIRDQRRTARLSLRKLSNMAGISNPYLSQIERGLRRPSAEILQAIAKALRISAETMYVKAGILEERGDTPDPVTAVLRDMSLTEKQKQVLVEIYQTFRHENEIEARPADAALRAVALARRAPATPAAKAPARRRPATKPATKPARKKPAAKKKKKPAKRKATTKSGARRTAAKRTTRTSGTRTTTKRTTRRTPARRTRKRR